MITIPEALAVVRQIVGDASRENGSGNAAKQLPIAIAVGTPYYSRSRQDDSIPFKARGAEFTKAERCKRTRRPARIRQLTSALFVSS